jgi:hypothetical protein
MAAEVVLAAGYQPAFRSCLLLPADRQQPKGRQLITCCMFMAAAWQPELLGDLVT